jgi:glycosyltransferase involved in cell wall biosynthesis
VSQRLAVLAATALPWHRPGGLERHVFQLCRWLRKRGVEVDLYTSTPEHSADPFAGDPGFRLCVVDGTPFRRERFLVVASRTTLYPLFALRMGERVAAAHRAAPYAAVVAQGMTGFGYARSGASAPLVLNPQGMEEALTPSAAKRALYVPFRAMLRFAAARAAAVVATDRVLIGAVERILRVRRERVLVIPNAIDVDECHELARGERGREVIAAAGFADAAPLLVSVGRLAPNKGFEIAIEALAMLRDRLPPAWRWIVVGDGPERAALGRSVVRHALGGRVRFLGATPDRDLHGVLARADLFLNPTLYEGSSLVTLEAMSHACAVVATRAGGIPDKIEEGTTGWLAEPADARSLADAVVRWQTSPEPVRDRVRRAAAERCREQFDWPICVDRYLEAIRRL